MDSTLQQLKRAWEAGGIAHEGWALPSWSSELGHQLNLLSRDGYTDLACGLSLKPLIELWRERHG